MLFCLHWQARYKLNAFSLNLSLTVFGVINNDLFVFILATHKIIFWETRQFYLNYFLLPLDNFS